MEIIDRQEEYLSKIFDMDRIDYNDVFKIDNPGGGECLYTAIVNFLRIEFLVKKHLYKYKKGGVDKNIYLPILHNSGSKIHNEGETLKDEGRLLRLMVCRWLVKNRNTEFSGTGKTIKEFLFDPEEMARKADNSDAIIRDNFSDGDNSLTLDEKFKKYINLMKNPGTYGGTCEFYALGHILKRNIKCYRQDERGVIKEYGLSGIGYNNVEFNNKRTIGIYHNTTGIHFKTLYPKKTDSCVILGMVRS